MIGLRRFSRARVLAALALLAPVACEHPASPAGDENAPPVAASVAGATGLVHCPTEIPRSVRSTVAAQGGIITAGQHTVHIPAGALAEAAVLTITEPASDHMEVSIQANGLEHFDFGVPVTITLSYARCTGLGPGQGPLRVWHIDEESKAFLEDMGGTDDKLARTVTFTTGHLSGYAVAQ